MADDSTGDVATSPGRATEASVVNNVVSGHASVDIHVNSDLMIEVNINNGAMVAVAAAAKVKVEVERGIEKGTFYFISEGSSSDNREER
jgi:hypothetical protein